MKKIKWINLLTASYIAFSYSNISSSTKAPDFKNEQEIECSVESNNTISSYLWRGIQPSLKMPDRNPSLTIEFSGIYSNAKIKFNGIDKGNTDKNGNLSFTLYPRLSEKNQLSIESTDTTELCYFVINDDSTLKCTGKKDFKCIITKS